MRTFRGILGFGIAAAFAAATLPAQRETSAQDTNINHPQTSAKKQWSSGSTLRMESKEDHGETVRGERAGGDGGEGVARRSTRNNLHDGKVRIDLEPT